MDGVLDGDTDGLSEDVGVCVFEADRDKLTDGDEVSDLDGVRDGVMLFESVTEDVGEVEGETDGVANDTNIRAENETPAEPGVESVTLMVSDLVREMLPIKFHWPPNAVWLTLFSTK